MTRRRQNWSLIFIESITRKNIYVKGLDFKDKNKILSKYKFRRKTQVGTVTETGAYVWNAGGKKLWARASSGWLT